MNKMNISLVIMVIGAMLTSTTFGDVTAYTGFDYSGTTLTGQSSINDIGLADSWAGGAVGIAPGSLDYPESSGFSAIGNRIRTQSGSNLEGTRMFTADAQIDMDKDKDYYFSFLMRSGSNRYMGLALRGTGVTIIELGIGSEGRFRICYGAGCSTNILIEHNTTYLVAGKIEARAAGTDRIALKVYKSTDIIDSIEPDTWTITRSGTYTGIYTQLGVRGGNNNIWEIDEIRFGESWFDVAYFSYQSYSPSPISGAVGVEIAPTLAWKASSEVTAFDVYLGTDPNALSPVASDLTDTALTVESLQLGTTYYWRVDSIAGGAVTVGDVWMFTTAGKAASPQPPNNSGNNATVPLLGWQGDFLAESYNVYFGTSPDALTLRSTTAEPQFQIADALEENSTYYWRVDQLDGSGEPIMSGDVWSFSTGGLFGHWKLDEASGTAVVNAVSGGPNGTIVAQHNDYSRTSGVVDRAIKFDPLYQFNDEGPRIELTDIGGHANINTDQATIAMWLRPDGPQQSVVGLFVNRFPEIAPEYGAGIQLEGGSVRYLWNGTHYGWNSGITLPIDTWAYLALVIERTQATLYLIQDGQVHSAVNTATHFNETFGGATRIGAEVLPRERFFRGIIDDVRIYNRPLNEAELATIYDQSSLAKYPDPSNGQINVTTSPDLQWTPGVEMTSQNLYFRSDPNFADAVPVATDITDSVWPVGSELELDTTYYWRVDTITDANVITGNVWSFTTVPPKAYNPAPGNDAVEVSPFGTMLTWNPAPGGPYTHQVYMSTAASDVVERRPSAYQGEFENAVFDPGTLDWDTRYFWVVDEFDGQNLYAGDLWSFTTISPVCDPPLLMDANGDCVVDIADFAILASEWLDCNLIPAEACP